MKPTLLSFAILGLIQDNPLSGYRIRKFFDETALGNYSSSPGTIYPALKKLEKLRLIERKLKKGTTKAHFSITSKGISILKNWLLAPIEKKEVEQRTHELLLKFAFMENLISEKDITNFLTTFRDLLKEYIQELQKYYDKEANNMPLHGRLAFQHGIESSKVTLKWCKKSLVQLTQNK